MYYRLQKLRQSFEKRFTTSPFPAFRSDWYTRHNARRQEHLATLGLPLHGRTVLEVGAGIGDHTQFFLDRGCTVTVTEPRANNLKVIRQRFHDCEALQLDLERPSGLEGRRFDVTYCYGVIYHLSDPTEALRFMAERTGELLLVETCVSFGEEAALNPVSEPRGAYSQAVSGIGCRPTRTWVMERLAESFDHVYATLTQPNHPHFPLDWNRPEAHGAGLSRAVFVASRASLDDNPDLSKTLPSLSRRGA